MGKRVTIEEGSEDWYRRNEAARSYARYHLGDGLWAYGIIHAFLHPDEAMEDLEEEMADARIAERAE